MTATSSPPPEPNEGAGDPHARAGDPRAPARRKRAFWLVATALASLGASIAFGVVAADYQRSPRAVAVRAWHGKLTKVARSGAEASAASGVVVVTDTASRPLSEGAEIAAGMRVRTDGRTRLRLELDDGSVLVVDRSTDGTIGADPRTMTVTDGSILADIAHVDGAPFASFKTPSGEVRVLGTKLAVTTSPERTNVEVLRGEVEVATSRGRHKVFAGQEGVAGSDGLVDVTPVSDLAQRTAFGAELALHNEDADAPASGLGELRAKRPGRTDERDHAVHLRKHAVVTRIAGNVARTEIDETFSNDTDDELEGIYRFPLPAGAQIERLALEVDGKLVDGEFVDRSKASAIWRGAIQNAAPKSPRPREEIVWVPGPWHDPALLEWQRGGRFELRIFPIPKRASRRVVIAYTEVVAPTSGIRRYVYPLAQGASSKLTIDQFSIDAQVLGHDARVPVRVRGYELDKKREGSADVFTTTQTGFTPSGDLAIEYSLDDKASDAVAWAYRDERSGPGPSRAKEPDRVGTDAFVAIALRPKLPKWVDEKPRDQVIVVDTGLSMFGERFERAKRLVVQMTQEMDRRDRVTVLACDVVCRSLPKGFAGPGGPTANDVDAFLRGIRPDGASDLVGAVRAASNVAGRDGARDLRIVLVSDGVATAGYRSAGRVAAEVGDALGGKSGSVVTVPIGSDADVDLLASVARGGGGVVVPYQPGERLEASALAVLNATYGTTLRDVELALPEGLHDVAPASLPPLRAGAETIVTARMSADAVKGDIVLRGKVGGDPFEAKYPIELRATTDRGNAFVPRLFAAARIADREHEAGDAAHAELVALSRRFSVPSRATSLLVLESEAMFNAFGIARAERAAAWTGEGPSQAVSVAAAKSAELDAFGDEEKDGLGAGSSGLPRMLDLAQKDKAEGFGVRSAAPPPAATMAPPKAAAPETAPAKRRTLDSSNAWEPEPWSRPSAPRFPGGRFMKKVFVRRASVTTDVASSVTAEKLAQARAAVAAAPDERARHKELVRQLALGGHLDELHDALEKWSARDPLDVDLVSARADLAARRGDRDGALRILGGTLAATALASADASALATAVARSYERLGRSESCAFDITAAELRPSDAAAIARAVDCEQAQGRGAAAERWLSSVKEAARPAVRTALASRRADRSESTSGDIVVSATWTGGEDLDLALVDPSGRRAGAVSRMRGALVDGATAHDHERLALSTSDAGAFVVEIDRVAPLAAVVTNGTLTIKAFGQSRTIPFSLIGNRAAVARVDVRWDTELVPLSDFEGTPENTPQPGVSTIDRPRAVRFLSLVDLQPCRASGQVGTGHVTVTFAPTGRVADVIVDDAAFSGTPAGRCVQSAFWSAPPVEPFSGPSVRIGHSFTLGR